MRSQRGSLFHIKHLNPALTWAGIASLVATTLVIYVPFLEKAFEFEHISLERICYRALPGIPRYSYR